MPPPSTPSPARRGPALVGGQELGGRFRVVRFIAHGGMGEVYEAEDLELGAAVAVKILRPELAAAPRALDRLRREIALARQVTHRNVCRIFDVFRHRWTDAYGREQEVTGLSMELLHGETLAERLARAGVMAPVEALPLVAQMAAALDAAHAAGVVHRDFKPSNVTLEPAPAEEGGVRVVVTDFGLAMPDPAAGSSGPQLTDEHTVVGTADYMAPEQALGQAVTTAADVYALGVVMFEMVTGHRPHEADSPMATMLKRIRDDAPSARALRPGLDRRWERVIRRCLDPEPARRFPRAGDVVATLAGSSTAVSSLSWIGPTPRVRTLTRLWQLGALAALLLAAALAAGLWRSTRPASARWGGPVQVTAWPRLELDPVFSPDGGSLAFAANRGGSFELFVLQFAAGSREVQVTADGGSNFQPAWSPDGRLIAFYSARRGGIWAIPALGGTPRQLTEFGSHPAWSPDGRRLAFSSDATAALSANATAALPPSTLWLVDADGRNPRQVTRPGEPPGGHGAPIWSPAGDRLYFTASDRRLSRLWSVAADGSGLVPVVPEGSVAFDPEIAPDGRSLYFSAVTAGERYGVWRIEVDPSSGAPRERPAEVLTAGGASVRHFAISQDGRRLVYTALATASNLWSLPLDPRSGAPAAAPRPLTQGSGRNNRPAFSPDGEHIAFDRWQIGSSRDIFVMRPDGTDLRQVTVDPHADTGASWAPDSRRVVYLSDRDTSWSLWSVRTDGSGEARLARLDPGADAVRLSPDGTRIAYHVAIKGGPANLWVADVDGSNARQVSFDTEMLGFPCWSPDGRSLAAELRRGDDDHVVLLPADGGEVRRLTDEPGKNWPYSFSPDGDKVAYVRLRDGAWDLWWVSAPTGTRRQLTHNEPSTSYVRYPAWSPRGDAIVYESAETAGDLWLVEQARE
jgi:Tol biopolymer transport system component